ncbi:MAG: ADP-ribosylglycohydrolase family protein [Marinicellaceae bacterium]
MQNKITLDQIKGCLLGCAFGDTLGASFEGGYLERALWHFFGCKNGRMRFTDDTQMSLDIINSILMNKGVNQNHLAQTFANNYKWSRGYGPGAARTLKKIKKGVHWSQANTSQFAEGSFGNGAAMRAPVLSLFYSGEELKEKVKLTSEITHAHPEAIEGATLVALTASKALKQESLSDILECLRNASEIRCFKGDILYMGGFFQDGKTPINEFTAQLGNSIEAKNSCVTAICYALYFRDASFLDMFKHIKNGKGDVDTIAAMAGAIWGCFNGFDAMKNLELNQIESGESIEELAKEIFEFNKQKEQV